MVSNVSCIDTSLPVAIFTSSPSVASDWAMARNPRQVSSTKLKSRVGVKSPTFISRAPLAICVMIVGIMARADWRGP